MKICFTCKKEKENFEFHRDKNRDDGLYPNCKWCRKKESRESYDRRQSTIVSYQAKYRVNHPREMVLYGARDRSKKKKIPFNLTIEDIVIPSICPVLGIPIEVKYGRGRSSNSPSIDRIDPKGGYTKDNIIIVSWRANDIKGNATTDELSKVTEFYKKYEKKASLCE